MLKNLVVLLLLSLAPSLFAQTADVYISDFNISVTPTHTGERFAIFMRWRNDGPNPATIVNATVTGTPAPFFILGVGTSGWPCSSTAGGDTFRCQGHVLQPGGFAEMVLNVLAPAHTSDGTFTLSGSVEAAEADPNPSNNSREATLTLEQSSLSGDLSITPTAQTFNAAAGEIVTIPFVVRSTANLHDTFAVLTVPIGPNIPAFSAEGEGWSCSHGAYGPQLVICTRTSVAANTDTPLLVRFTAPATDGLSELTAFVRAEDLDEVSTANNLSRAGVRVGPEDEPPPPTEHWSRILIPLTGEDVPGSNNSLWRTETTALIASNTQLAISPTRCELGPITPCTEDLPLNVPFEAKLLGFYARRNSPYGQFIYLPEADAQKLRINSRVYDVNRQVETAGAEIPLARDHDFTSSTISLLGIPVASHYRHTLRVYGYDGTALPVEIRVYANNELSPRSVTQWTLAPAPGGSTVTSQHLPTLPSYLQFDLGQLLPLAGFTTLRVDITPLEQKKIWAFVSTTNNDTHHVTTFSAQ